MSLREVWRPSKTAYDKTKQNKKAERLVTNLSSQRGEEIVVSSVGFGAGPAGKASILRGPGRSSGAGRDPGPPRAHPDARSAL